MNMSAHAQLRLPWQLLWILRWMSRFNWAIILSGNSIILLTLPIRRRLTRPAGSGKRLLSD